MKVWVVTGTSESSDNYGPFVLSKKPSQKTLRRLCKLCDWPDEEEGLDPGPGDFGSYTYLSISECEIDEKG